MIILPKWTSAAVATAFDWGTIDSIRHLLPVSMHSNGRSRTARAQAA